MEEAAARKNDRTPDSGMFDVPAWLGDLSGEHDWLVSRSFTRRKVEFVIDYTTSHGSNAQVTMRAVTAARSASWELRADLGDSRAGVVIPARTRIKW
ncbi:MAG TPA: hypothetical protein VIF08_01700 [Candidatus Limnocylindrales bacterium]|jgi:hypothetical protein